MKEYHYDPLRDDEIRLLALHAGDRESSICCTLGHARLASEATVTSASDPLERDLLRVGPEKEVRRSKLPMDYLGDSAPATEAKTSVKKLNCLGEPGSEVVYDALSYCWGSRGSQASPKRISLNECDFQVSETLDIALRHLRLRYQDRILWIDAICINQDDMEERGRQVLRMGNIYKKATAVRIWLGPETAESDRAMKWITESFEDSLFEAATTITTGTVHSEPGASLKSRNREERTITKTSNLESRFKARDSSIDPISSNARMIGAACRLVSRSWFTRRWVIQEIAFASHAFVHCGYFGVGWKRFSKAIRLLPQIWTYQAQRHGNAWVECTSPRMFGGQTSPDSSGYWGDPEAQSALRLLFASENVLSNKVDQSNPATTLLYDLQTLVAEFASFEVSDPCDAIYAILPIAKDSHLWRLRYTKDVMEVYREFISYSVQTSGSLDILLRPWACSCPNLPSWISVNKGLKFAMVGGKRLRQHAELFIGTAQSKIYNASGMLEPAIRFPGPSEEPRLHGLPKMIVSGFVLDTIAEERGHVNHDSKLQNQTKNWPTWAQQSAKLKGNDVSNCTLKDLLRTGDFPKENHFPVVFTRRWLITEEGRLGLGPQRTRVEDKVVILLGCNVPVILRKELSFSGVYTIIGECFIQGVMDGETVEDLKDGKYNLGEHFPTVPRPLLNRNSSCDTDPQESYDQIANKEREAKAPDASNSEVEMEVDREK